MQPPEWKINIFCTHLFDAHKFLILLVADRRILRGFFHTFLGCPSRQSAIPPKADIRVRRSDVRFVPIADIVISDPDHMNPGFRGR